jgi:hypothetical protein
MEASGNKLNIVILDSCRNNPFARGWRSTTANGILARMDAPTGSIIAYATGPGDTAADGDSRNGTYTKHFLKNMETPGISIEEFFKRVRIGVIKETGKKQVPWETNSLTGNFYFINHLTVTPEVSTNSTNGSTDVLPQKDTEITYWNTIQSTNNPSYFKAYIDKYGTTGQFTSIAKIRYEELLAMQRPSPTPTPVPKDSSSNTPLYASLAIDGNQGSRWGFSYNRVSFSAADQQALSQCGAGCKVIKNFKNGCGAYAADQVKNSTIWGYGLNADAQTAKDKALSACQYQGGTQCIIRVWACNSH